MGSETLLVERLDGVVTITLNRPDRKNAVSAAMWEQLESELAGIARRRADRVVVVTGAGGEFCSGADLSDSSGGDDSHALTKMRALGDVCQALATLPQPTIAKVSGTAVGAGMNMALVCDLVVADTTARFSEIFARRGLTIDFGGSWILPRRVGLHRAKELALFADLIDVNEAERIGLINRVVEPDRLDAFVDDWARRLAAGPPVALRQTKRLLNNGLNVTLDQALDDEAAAQVVNGGTKDMAEAMRAFKEKRAPAFEGR